MIPDIIKSENDLRFDRSHLSTLGAGAIDFESVYIVTTADFNPYMNIQQRVLLAIYKAFTKERIEFSIPTQRLIIEPPVSDTPEPVAAGQRSVG